VPGVIGGAFAGLDSPYEMDKRSWSLFGQYEFDLTNQITAIGGFRWIDERVEFDYQNNFVRFVNGQTHRNGNPNVLATLVPDPSGEFSGVFDEGLWSAKVELDWRPSDDWLLYASWNRGVKGGGFNSPFDSSLLPGGVADPNGVDPALFAESMSFDEEELDAFEVGFKSTLFDGLARVNGSIYYNDYEDFQAFQIVQLATFLANAEAESAGAELEIQATPIQGLDFMFGVAYNDMDVTLQDGTETTSVQSPRWNLNGMLRYEWPVLRGTNLSGMLALQSDFLYRSEHFFSLTRQEPVTEDGYAVANLRATYTSDAGDWELAVFAKNVTDEEYLVQTFDLSADLGFTEQYFGRPRWVGGSISYRF